jgi:hypothetical protein
MEINGIMVALLDIPAEYTQEYNRWYDLDHLPEHISKGDVVTGKRYVAPHSLQDADGVQASEFTGGYPPYLTLYFFGGPVSFAGEESQTLWREKDRTIVKAGRYWVKGEGRFNRRLRLSHAIARPTSLVASEAIPHLPHRGVIVCLGRAPSASRRQEAIDWWDGTHLVDLFAVPGLLAALRLDPVDPAEGDLVVHLLLCEEPPADVMAGIQSVLRYQGAVGRYPAYGGVYESVAVLPYERIVPFEYDFEIKS